MGTVSTSKGVSDWYPKIEKSSFTPPGWLFGPVWTALYAMIWELLTISLHSKAQKAARRVIYVRHRVFFSRLSLA